jgi:hypothetical protein
MTRAFDDEAVRGRSPSAVEVGAAADGTLTYLVAQPPEALPPVLTRDLELAWDASRAAALAARWGVARLFRFRRSDGSVTDLALTDRDARCWAGAVDATQGIATLSGLAVCLRLLALVDLLTRAGWAGLMVHMRPDGAEIDVALLRLAATTPLTREARFDESALRNALDRGRLVGSEGPDASHALSPPLSSLPSGAPA